MGNSISQDLKLWIIQRVIELQDVKSIQKLVDVLQGENPQSAKTKKHLPKHIQTYSRLLDQAEADITAGKVHTHESIGKMIADLD